jgi:hypothetical protein
VRRESERVRGRDERVRASHRPENGNWLVGELPFVLKQSEWGWGGVLKNCPHASRGLWKLPLYGISEIRFSVAVKRSSNETRK